jgi:23S rRNA (adenine2503-C2)-methyltransferase
VARYDLDRDDIAALLAGDAPYRVDQTWDGLWRRGLELDEITELPKSVRRQLASCPELDRSLTPERVVDSEGGATRKWLWRLVDGTRIETVLMHYPGRSTVCVSSQAGCAMACSFCATGQAGFTRHLTSGEIIEQVVMARRAAAGSGRRLSNVVFMGMGEPLANYDRVWQSVERMHGDLGFSARHLTISTIGVVPGIRRLAAEALPVNLAVSLHAANDALRDSLVPLNKRYPLADLVAACRGYLDAKGRRLSFEWALIAGVNDRRADARELAAIATELRAHVNLIPLNPTAGYATPGTPRRGVVDFRDWLRARGVNATVRQNRGTDIDAACGQLAGMVEAARGSLTH